KMVDTVTSVRDILEKRVNALGVAEPIIQVYGKDTAEQVANQIIVELAGVDPERAKNILQKTAKLEFRLVHPDKQMIFGSREEAIKSFPNGVLPPDYEVLPNAREARADQSAPTGGYYVVRKVASLAGDQLQSAHSAPSPNSANYHVTFSLSPTGRDLFTAVTGQNVGKLLAIVLDGQVRSAPRIN